MELRCSVKLDSNRLVCLAAVIREVPDAGGAFMFKHEGCELSPFFDHKF